MLTHNEDKIHNKIYAKYIYAPIDNPFLTSKIIYVLKSA